MDSDEEEKDTLRIGDKGKEKQVPVQGVVLKQITPRLNEEAKEEMYRTGQTDVVPRRGPLKVETWEEMELLTIFGHMFPPDYEFYENEAEQLWYSLDLQERAKWNDPFFQFSRIDHSTGIPMYKLEKRIDQSTELEKRTSQFVLPSKYLRIYDVGSCIPETVHFVLPSNYLRIYDVGSCIPKTVQHVSVSSSIDSSFLKKLYVAKGLRTLLILRGAGSRINCLPCNFFEKLRLLELLDLSHTDITELPSSIGYAQQLRYLNLSCTSVVELPSSLCNILTLQFLKLTGCLKLRGLPKNIRRLTSLRHLHVDVSCLLVSMPPRVGELTKLQTLPAFVINEKHGWHIDELKNLNDLHQTLCILRLENVSSLEEANGAFLHEKHCLEKLEFHWSRFVDGFGVLESLRPSESIKELEISGYGGVKFPNWVDRTVSLTAITIHNCSKCNALPTLGRLPSLKLLHISHMNEVKVIAQEFLGFRHSSVTAFPCLEQLTFNGMPELSEWIGVKKKDFPVLQKLSISACSKLTALPELSFFRSLQHLEISLCSLLASIPAGLLSVSLQSIVIVECPKLEEWYHSDGENSGKIEQVPFKFI